MQWKAQVEECVCVHVCAGKGREARGGVGREGRGGGVGGCRVNDLCE